MESHQCNRLRYTERQQLQVKTNPFPAGNKPQYTTAVLDVHIFGVVFTSDEGGTRRLTHRFEEANALFLDFHRSCGHNGSFQTPQSCQFLNRYLSNPHLWSGVLRND